MKLYEKNNTTINKNIEEIFDILFSFTSLTPILTDMEISKKGDWKVNKGIINRKDIFTLNIKNIPNEIIDTFVDNKAIQLEIRTTVIIKRDDYYKVKLDYKILNIKEQFYTLLNTDVLIKLFAIAEITKINDNKSVVDIKAHITSYIMPLMNDMIELFSYNYCDICVNKLLDALQK